MTGKGPKAPPPVELYPVDEMSTGEASALQRRALLLNGKPEALPTPQPAPELKTMTGAQLAFRPSAPPRAPASSSSAKPITGTQPAFQPRPALGAQPTGKTGSQPAIVLAYSGL